jgi:hypothetical protein
VVCSREKNLCKTFSSKVNHVFDFLGRYTSIQVGM